MYRLFLALRYLLTRPINLLSIGGITISVWALVVVVSVFSGYLHVVEQHVRTASADAAVIGLPPWAEWSRLSKVLRDDPNVAAAAPRLAHYGMLQRPGQRPPPAPLPGRGALIGGDQPFLSVIGIDPAAELETTGFAGWLVAPEVPPALRCADPAAPLAPRDGRPTVLIGLERMQREGLAPGDRVVLTTAALDTAPDGDKAPRKVQLELTVGGAFKTAHAGFDGNTVFVALDTLRHELYGERDDFVPEIAVRVRDERQLDATVERLERAVQAATERDSRGFGRVLTWRQKHELYLGNVAHQRGLLKIVLIVIMVVAAFLMLATLSMMVTEKTGDIGILAAMGGTPLGVTTVFLSCGLVITGVGIVLGLGSGTLTAVYLEEIRQGVRWATGVDLLKVDVYGLDRVPCYLEPVWMLEVAGMALLTGLVVSALPALRAAFHDPLVSLRGS
ncbi:MAG: ABC transporter permease [Planctomycetes bacterium]|nr:ABC transporter permease [Planctomycetota bacterium]